MLSQSDPDPESAGPPASGSGTSRSRTARARDGLEPRRGLIRRDVRAREHRPSPMNLVTPDLSVPAAVREATDSSASGAESVELNTSTPAVDAEHRNSPGSVSGCTPVSRAERAEWTVERRPRKGRLLPLAPPAAQSSPPAARGPAWLVTLVDFIERATSRTTSLWQHLTMFFSYCLVIAGLPIFAVAWVVTRFVAVGSWPGMSSIAAVAAAGGLTIIMRRGQRGQPGGASESHQDSPDLADGRAENNPPAAGEDEAGRETPDA